MAAVAIGVDRLHYRAGRAAPPPPHPKHPVVVVLGFPTMPSGQPSPVQRWRVARALEVLRQFDGARLICSGGAVANRWVEAETMAALAVSGGADPSLVEIEGESPNSWENAANTRDLVADCDAVVLVSDPLHAARVRSYWLAQEPADEARVFVADVDRSWRDLWILTPAAAIEIARRLRDLLR